MLILQTIQIALRFISLQVKKSSHGFGCQMKPILHWFAYWVMARLGHEFITREVHYICCGMFGTYAKHIVKESFHNYEDYNPLTGLYYYSNSTYLTFPTTSALYGTTYYAHHSTTLTYNPYGCEILNYCGMVIPLLS